MAFYGTGLVNKAIAKIENLIIQTDPQTDRYQTLCETRDLLVELRDTDGGNDPA